MEQIEVMSRTEALAQLLQAYRGYPMPPDQEAYIVVYNYVVELEQRLEQFDNSFKELK